MEKYCGKCGTKLDEETGLCPKCDSKALEQSEPAGRKGIVIVVLAVLLIGVAAVLWLVQSNNAPDAMQGTTVTEGETMASAESFGAVETEAIQTKTETLQEETESEVIEYYLGDTIVTVNRGNDLTFSLDYLGCMGNEGYGPSGSVFFDVGAGPSVVIGTGKADFDGNGAEDKLIVSLEVAEAPPFEREPYGVSEGMNFLQLRLDVFFSDGADNTIHQQTQYEPITADTKETFTISIQNNQIVSAKGTDISSTFADGQSRFLPVTETAGIHKELMYVYGFDAYGNAQQKFGAGTAFLYNANKQELQESRFDAFGEGWGGFEDVTLLYSSGAAGAFSTEKEACQAVNAVLGGIYGVEGYAFEPCSWEMRWNNLCLPEPDSDGFVCRLTTTSSVSCPEGENQSAGVTTFQAEFGR